MLASSNCLWPPPRTGQTPRRQPNRSPARCQKRYQLALYHYAGRIAPSDLTTSPGPPLHPTTQTPPRYRCHGEENHTRYHKAFYGRRHVSLKCLNAAGNSGPMSQINPGQPLWRYVGVSFGSYLYIYCLSINEQLEKQIIV